jgi:hypothetical protein
VQTAAGRPSGGRTWWAHFEFTRINIEPTILRKKIEDLREARALMSIANSTSRDGECSVSADDVQGIRLTRSLVEATFLNPAPLIAG